MQKGSLPQPSRSCCFCPLCTLLYELTQREGPPRLGLTQYACRAIFCWDPLPLSAVQGEPCCLTWAPPTEADMASFLTCHCLCNIPNTIHKSCSESMGWHCLGNPSHWKILRSREGSSCLVFLLIIQPVAYHFCWEHLPAVLQKREYGREMRNFAYLEFSIMFPTHSLLIT